MPHFLKSRPSELFLLGAAGLVDLRLRETYAVDALAI